MSVLSSSSASSYRGASCPNFGNSVQDEYDDEGRRYYSSRYVEHHPQQQNSSIAPFSIPNPLHQQQHQQQQQPGHNRALQPALPPPPTISAMASTTTPWVSQSSPADDGHSHVLSPVPSQQYRSMSLPDMSVYATTTQTQQQQQRHSRLARNRASARSRRMKKKQLIDEFTTICLYNDYNG